MIGGNFAICLIAYSMIVQTQCEIYQKFISEIKPKVWEMSVGLFFKKFLIDFKYQLVSDRICKE